MNKAQAKMILARLHKNSGFTFDTNSGSFVSTGVVVSPYKSLEQTIWTNDITHNHILDYVDKNQQTLIKNNHYFGGWLNENLAYLDISIIVSSLRYALHLAKITNQISVFDLSTFVEHKVKQEKQTHAVK